MENWFDDILEILRATQKALRRRWDEANERQKDPSISQSERDRLEEEKKRAAEAMKDIAEQIKNISDG